MAEIVVGLTVLLLLLSGGWFLVTYFYHRETDVVVYKFLKEYQFIVELVWVVVFALLFFALLLQKVIS